MPKKIELRDALIIELNSNKYLKDLHQKLLKTYGYRVFGRSASLDNKEVQDLLTFADIMAKTEDFELEQTALEIVICLSKLYSDSHSIKFYKNMIFEELGNYSRFEEDSFDFDNSVDSLIGRIQKKNEQSKRRFPVGDGYFIGEQRELYNSISEDLNSFSAPTSMGKSFLMKMFIEEKVRSGEGKNFVYLVPTKALITEVTNDLCDRLGDGLKNQGYRIVNHFDSIGGDDPWTHFIYVMTPERFEYLLMNNFPSVIDYLFIDEAQNISKADGRSTVYYRIFDLLKGTDLHPKITFAAPLVENPGIYETLSNIEKGSSLKANLSPVSQVYFVIDKEGQVEIYDRISIEFIIMDNLKMGSTDSSVNSLLHRINGQNLVYRNTINNAVSGACSWAENCQVYPDYRNQRVSKYIAEQVHDGYYLSDLVLKGVGYHFGKIPDEVRSKIEISFCKGLIDTLFCTSTLMQGVNLPADNIIIDNTRNGGSDMNAVQFKNLTGRVGRLSNSMLGNVFTIATSDRAKKKFKKLIRPNGMEVELSLDTLIDGKTIRKISKDLKAGDLTLQSVREEKVNQAKFDAIRKFALIYLNDLQNASDNIITEHFNKEISSDDQMAIKRKFVEKYGDRIEDDVNFSVDQSVELEERIKETEIDYPPITSLDGELNIAGTLSFLRDLSEIYNWPKYETDIAANDENELVLHDYAEFLLRWMSGDSLYQLCDYVIEKRKTYFNYLDRSEKIRNKLGINGNRWGNGSMDETNLSIHVTLEALSTIQFKFSNYFLKFSRTLKNELNTNVLENDWYQYLEYGTIDDNVIWLEQLGYSRSSAIKIVQSNVGATDEDVLGQKVVLIDRLKSIRNEEINLETERIIKNYPDVFVNEVN